VKQLVFASLALVGGTVYTIPTDEPIRDAVVLIEVAGPRIRGTGDGLVRPGMVPSPEVLNILGTMPRETPRTTIENAEQAASFARRLLDSGVDGIKLHSISDPSILGAAVAEAQRAGWDAALVKVMLDRHVVVIPTLTIWTYLRRHDRLSPSSR
jgi:hypothetical protein